MFRARRAVLFATAAPATLALVAAAAAAPAQAQLDVEARADASIVWRTAPGCPPRATLIEELEGLLGRAPRPDEARRLSGRITRVEAAYALQLIVAGPRGESTRRLEGPSCDALTRAGALVLALAIDPDAVAARQAARAEGPVASGPVPPGPTDSGGSSDPSAAPGSEVDGPAAVGAVESPRGDATPDPPAALEAAGSTSASAAPPGAAARLADEGGARAGGSALPRTERAPTERAPSADPSAERPVRFVAGVRGGVAFGPLPGPAAGVWGSLGVGFGPVELAVEGGGLFEQTERLQGMDAGATMGLAVGRVRGCGAWLVADEVVEILPCLALEIGGAWARGVDIPRVQSGVAPWVAGVAAFEGRVWPLDGLGIGLFAELVVPALRAPVVLWLGDERRVVYRAFAVAGQFGLSVTGRLR